MPPLYRAAVHTAFRNTPIAPYCGVTSTELRGTETIICSDCQEPTSELDNQFSNFQTPLVLS